MLLRIVVFVCGAAVMSLEMLGSRVLTANFGSSLQVWGALIGTFIGALSLGYWLGGIAADRWPTKVGLAVIISISGILTALLVPLTGPINDFLFRITMSPEREIWLKPLLASAIVYGLPVVFLGAVSPYSIRLAARDLSKLGKR
ncbi:MAG: fused MFS/spermidine synthase, partial [Planctomycetes bacterium]|nr:fused MFS/spermidine synthase [Planctomycetota bacterium]